MLGNLPRDTTITCLVASTGDISTVSHVTATFKLFHRIVVDDGMVFVPDKNVYKFNIFSGQKLYHFNLTRKWSRALNIYSCILDYLGISGLFTPDSSVLFV